MRAWKILIPSLALACGLPMAGCQSTNGESGGYNTLSGDMNGTLSTSLENAHSAAVAAINDMGYRVEQDNMDATEAVIKTKDAADHAINIKLKKVTDRTTDVTIDQSVFTGSASKARLLFDKIRGHTPPM